MFDGDKGVTSYIEAMEHTSGGSYRISDWDSDYKNLKHYRYIRNKIVHENYASEDSMCSASDTAWLEDFYSRIMGGTDPLALYHKAITSQKAVKPSTISSVNNNRKVFSEPTASKNHSCVAALVISILSLIVGASFHGLRMHPENAEGYQLGCTIGTVAAIIASIAFVAFIVLLVRTRKQG